MLVFYPARLVLLAVPKTGTTALEGALAPHASLVIRDPPVLKHSPWYRYDRFVRPMLEDVAGGRMTTLAVVREPVSWLGSWFRYRQREDLPDPRNSTRGWSFEDYVAAYAAGGQRPKPADVGSQARFLGDRSGARRVDRVWRYEALPDLTRFLAERLDVRIAPRPLNVSPKMDLPLSDRTRQAFRESCPDEFAVWEEAEAGSSG